MNDSILWGLPVLAIGSNVFTKVVRLKKLGRKRLVSVHEQEDLQDAPRFLLTDALPWERGRVRQTWSDRPSCEVF